MNFLATTYGKDVYVVRLCLLGCTLEESKAKKSGDTKKVREQQRESGKPLLGFETSLHISGGGKGEERETRKPQKSEEKEEEEEGG